MTWILDLENTVKMALLVEDLDRLSSRSTWWAKRARSTLGVGLGVPARLLVEEAS